MPLEQYVGRFQDGGYIDSRGTKLVFQIRGTPYPTSMACHNATFIWLYQATHGGAMPPIAKLEGGSTQAFVNQLVLRGHPHRITEKTWPLPGDVLIFTDPDASQADHSCMAIRGGTIIAGYNQTGWFPGGLSHDFSAHHVSCMTWEERKIGTRRRVIAKGKSRYLWAIREATASGLMTEMHP